MPSKGVGFGVPKVQIGYPDLANNLSSMAAAVIDASSVAYTLHNRGSKRTPIAPGDYYYWLTLLGYDPNGGYAMTRASATPGSAETVGSGECLLLRMTKSNYGLISNFTSAIAVGIWLSTAATGNAQLCDYSLINTNKDWSFLVTELPGSQAPVAAIADLTSTNVTDLLGSTRTPQCEKLTNSYQTTGGVDFVHRKEGFTASPDDSLNFQEITGRATDVKFKILNPQLQDIMQSVGGDYTRFTDTDSSVIDQGSEDIFQIASSLSGNNSVHVTYGANQRGKTLRRLLLGQLTQNTDETTESNKKDAQTELDFLLGSASLDFLLDGMPTHITRLD